MRKPSYVGKGLLNLHLNANLLAYLLCPCSIRLLLFIYNDNNKIP